MTDPIPFVTPAEWSAWLAQTDATECWMLLHKKASGLPSITWEQAVIEALAHGWIDGVRKSVDDTSWLQRFTPRKPGSAWSQKNIAHTEKLIAEGRMQSAGMAQVTLARANGRWDTAYFGGAKATPPQDFLDAVAASPKATDGLAKLNTTNCFAIYYRLATAKRPETRARRMADYLAMLERGAALF